MSARVETDLGPLSTLARWRKALSPTGNTGDTIFRILLSLVALFVVGIVVAMVWALSPTRCYRFGSLVSAF